MSSDIPRRASRRLEPCEDSECRFCRGSNSQCCFGLREIGCFREEGVWGETVRECVRATIDVSKEGA